MREFQVEYNQRIIFFDVEPNKGFEAYLYFDDGSMNVGRGIVDITAALNNQKGQIVKVPLYSYEQPEDAFGASIAEVIIQDYVCPYEYEERAKGTYATIHYVAPPAPMPKSQCRIKAERIRAERAAKRTGELAKIKKNDEQKEAVSNVAVVTEEVPAINGAVETKEEPLNNVPVVPTEEVPKPKEVLAPEENIQLDNGNEQVDQINKLDNNPEPEKQNDPVEAEEVEAARSEKGVQATEDNTFDTTAIDAKIEELSKTNPEVARLSENMENMKREIDSVIEDVGEMISNTEGEGTDEPAQF